MNRLRALTHRQSALLAFALAVAALGTAYIAEFGFGLHPCEMCYWQRVPFGVIVVLALLAWFVPKIARPMLWLCTLGFAVSMALGAFHAGVEWEWWEGPGACSSGIQPGMSPAEILAHIKAAASVSCTAAAVRVLGISMAGWNAIYSLGCVVLMLLALCQPKQRG